MGIRIGFIGLGEMGLPMARNLIKAGHRLTAHNRSKGALEEIAKDGAAIAASAREAAASAEITIVMVRTTEQAVSVFSGPDGLLAGAAAGSIVVIMSTIDPTAVQRLSAEARAKSIEVLDAPVSGARQRAEAGTLTIMAGGPRGAFDRCREIFEVLGANTFYLGGSGMGEAAKLVNNLLLLVHINAAFEAMRLAEAAGVKMDVLRDLIKVSTGNSWIIENWEVASSWRDEYRPDGTMDLIYKDAQLTLNLGQDLRVPLHLGALASQLGRY